MRFDPVEGDDRPLLVNPHESGAPLEARVKSYLHVNCSTCHVSAGGGNARMELGLTTPVGGMGLIDQVPLHASFDIPDARLVAPGSPDRSVLHYRVSHRGSGQMPPLVSTEVDRNALKLIADWPRPPEGEWARFSRDTEQNWRTRSLSPGEW